MVKKARIAGLSQSDMTFSGLDNNMLPEQTSTQAPHPMHSLPRTSPVGHATLFLQAPQKVQRLRSRLAIFGMILLSGCKLKKLAFKIEEHASKMIKQRQVKLESWEKLQSIFLRI